MIGRFIQHQQVYLTSHKHTKLQPAALASGQSTYRNKHILTSETEGSQSVSGRLRLCLALIEHGVIKAARHIVEHNYLR